jgi:excisionase family DNA binding protein
MTSEKPIPIQEIVQLAGVSVGTIYRWIKVGKLKATKQGKTYEILFSENDKFLLAQL